MGWVQVLGIVLGSLVFLALIRDFMAGMGRERIWSDPAGDQTSQTLQTGLAPVVSMLKEEDIDDDLHIFADQQPDVRGRLA